MATAVAALAARMEQFLGSLPHPDPRRFFLGTYHRTTCAVGRALDDGLFEDPDWVGHWTVDFADRYLDALARYRRNPATTPEPWRLALGADPGLPPEAHVLLGINAHINFDQPQSLIAVIADADFVDPALLASRQRDHERIDAVLAGRVAAEDAALEDAGGRRSPLDRLLSPANRRASRILLREARRKVWANTALLHAARLRGPGAYATRVAQLEAVSAARVRDLLRPGPVLLRLAVRGFGVRLPPDPHTRVRGRR